MGARNIRIVEARGSNPLCSIFIKARKFNVSRAFLILSGSFLPCQQCVYKCQIAGEVSHSLPVIGVILLISQLFPLGGLFSLLPFIPCKHVQMGDY